MFCIEGAGPDNSGLNPEPVYLTNKEILYSIYGNYNSETETGCESHGTGNGDYEETVCHGSVKAIASWSGEVDIQVTEFEQYCSVFNDSGYGDAKYAE